MKIFKRKTRNKFKVSKGNKFLQGLKDAIDKRKSGEEYKKTFLAIVDKADKLGTNKKGKENYQKIRESINKEMLKDSIDYSTPTHFNLQKEYGLGFTHSDGEVKIHTLPEPKIPTKFNLWFTNFKLKIRDAWELTKEIGREIKYWLIAEYKIFGKLADALNRKKDEVNVRKVLKHKKSHLIEEYGYDKGTQHFNFFASNVNNSVRLHERMEKAGL